MAYYRITYFSQALHRPVDLEMLIPNDPREEAQPGPYSDRPMRTLFLLHGYSGKAENWVPEELPGRYNFAIVMPSAENSFYLNGPATGHAYETMLAQELVDYVRRTFHLANSAEDTCIAGFSMGGFGALHTGLAHPDRFGKIGALSSALIVHEIAHMKPGEDNGVANYEYYRGCFGDLETVEESKNNPETLIEDLLKAHQPIPEIYMCCGTEDFLLDKNRAFHAFLDETGVEHIYREGPGIHDMVFWREHIVRVVEWMFA